MRVDVYTAHVFFSYHLPFACSSFTSVSPSLWILTPPVYTPTQWNRKQTHADILLTPPLEHGTIRTTPQIAARSFVRNLKRTRRTPRVHGSGKLHVNVWIMTVVCLLVINVGSEKTVSPDHKTLAELQSRSVVVVEGGGYQLWESGLEKIKKHR